MTVRCNHCMSVFAEENILDQDGEEACPHCGKCGGLMDMASQSVPFGIIEQTGEGTDAGAGENKGGLLYGTFRIGCGGG